MMGSLDLEKYGPYKDKAELRTLFSRVKVSEAFAYLRTQEALKKIVIECSIFDLCEVEEIYKFIEEKQTITHLELLGISSKKSLAKAEEMLQNLSSTVTSIVLSFYPPANIALNLRTLVDILAQNQCITELLIRDSALAFLSENYVAQTLKCERLEIISGMYLKILDANYNFTNGQTMHERVDNLFENLAKNKTLRHFAMELPHATPSATFANIGKCLAENCHLNSIKFSHCVGIVKSIEEGLRGNTSLQQLHLHNCDVKCGEYEIIAKNSGSLRHLEIHEQNMKSTDWKDLIELLQLNADRKFIETLIFESPMKRALPLDTEEEIKFHLQRNVSLKNLQLHFCNARTDANFYEVLPLGLTKFSYKKRNAFLSRPELMRSICEAIAKHPSLQKVDLLIKGHDALLELLNQFPMNLRTLGLSVAEICSSFLVEIVNILNKNLDVKLKKLVIRLIKDDCLETPDRVLEFVKALPETSVEVLDITMKSFPPAKEAVLNDYLSRNYFIKKCTVNSFPSYFKQTRQFASISYRNKYLKKQQRFQKMKVAEERIDLLA